MVNVTRECTPQSDKENYDDHFAAHCQAGPGRHAADPARFGAWAIGGGGADVPAFLAAHRSE